MYGLLLENLAEYVKSRFGEEKWEEIRRQVGIASPSFGVHDHYDEDLLMKLAAAAQQVSRMKFIPYIHVNTKKISRKFIQNAVR